MMKRVTILLVGVLIFLLTLFGYFVFFKKSTLFDHVAVGTNPGTYTCSKVAISREILLTQKNNSQKLTGELSKTVATLKEKISKIENSRLIVDAETMGLVREHKRLIGMLMRIDPDAVAGATKDLVGLEKLIVQTAHCFISFATLEGTVQLSHIGLVDGSSLNENHFLVGGSSLHLAIPSMHEVVTTQAVGKLVRAEGFILDDIFLLDWRIQSPITPVLKKSTWLRRLIPEAHASAVNAPTTFGVQKILVIPAYYASDTSPGISNAAMSTAIAEVSSFFQRSSYNKLSYTGVIATPVQLTQMASCNTPLIAKEAIALADASNNYANYDFVIVTIPTLTCGIGGQSFIGDFPQPTFPTGEGNLSPAAVVLVRATLFNTKVLAHEIFHGLGLQFHANFYNCGALFVSGSCAPVNYGDAFDILGGNAMTPPGEPGMFIRETLNWLTPSNIQVVTANGN